MPNIKLYHEYGWKFIEEWAKQHNLEEYSDEFSIPYTIGLCISPFRFPKDRIAANFVLTSYNNAGLYVCIYLDHTLQL